MSKIYTPQEKQKIRSHPIYIKYSGAVPEDMRHLVYPDEAKPGEPVRRGRKTKEETSENGDNN